MGRSYGSIPIIPDIDRKIGSSIFVSAEHCRIVVAA